MLPKIAYFDIFLGEPRQSPTAFTPMRIKLAALNFADALKRAESLGFQPETIMRLERYTLKSRNGTTVMQFAYDSSCDTDVYLTGWRGIVERRKELEAEKQAALERPKRKPGRKSVWDKLAEKSKT